MAIPFAPYTFTDAVANDVTAARLNAIAQAARDAQLQPTVRVSHNTTNSCTTNVLTALACNTEHWDQAGGTASTQHDTATNNSRLTAQYAGIYHVFGSDLTWSANPTNATLQFRLNGGATIVGNQQLVSDWRTMGSSGLISLAVNDYLECMVRQISGGTLTIGAGFLFGMVRVG